MKVQRYKPRSAWYWPGWNIFEDDDLWPSRVDGDLSVYETEDEVVVEAKVPGVKKEEVDINYQDRVLTIRANHEESEKEKKKKKVVYKSSSELSYAFSTNIPCSINSAKIKAELKKGILTVSLPKTEEAKPTRIRVEGEE